MNKIILPGNTAISGIKLKVSDLERSLVFYSTQIGFQVFEKNNNYALLSASGKLPYQIFLEEFASGEPVSRRTAGLYHIAVKVPNRKELASELTKLSQTDIKFHGFSDHLVSEAIYLADPDGNGVEIYSDKPKELWKWEKGQVKMETLPLDIESLLNEVRGTELKNGGIHPYTILGHIHLRVSDLIKAENFYSKTLGFEVTTREYPGAFFMSAGGYHHHIGTNIWSGQNIPPASERSLGLDHFVIRVPDKNTLNEIRTNLAQNEFGNIYYEDKLNSDGTLLTKDFDGIKIILSS
jgi:catechol 2,3-dioxygenase